MVYPLSWVEIDQEAIKNNLIQIKKLLSQKTKTMVVVKGNAYGHGMISIAKIALDSGVDWLAVFNLEEAIQLRQAKIANPILVLGYIQKDNFKEPVQENIVE